MNIAFWFDYSEIMMKLSNLLCYNYPAQVFVPVQTGKVSHQDRGFCSLSEEKYERNYIG